MLLGVAFATPRISRLPVTAGLIYLLVGMVLGPLVLGWIRVEPLEHAHTLEVVTEVAVIVSLFAAGLKLRSPDNRRRWLLPVRLAFVSMTLTVGLIAVAGVYGLGLPLGVAVLLGAVLAPTDPVLAGSVEVQHPEDRDKLRFSLTGEAGLNDGTAFPFVMLGLGLLGLNDLGAWGWRWWAVDVVWAIVGGLALGWAAGWGTAKLVAYLRRRADENVVVDDFLALGVLALTYGTALQLHTYGFLSAFALGLALRRSEQREQRAGRAKDAPDDVRHQAEVGRRVEIEGGKRPHEDRPHHDRPHHDRPHQGPPDESAPADMSRAVLGVNEQVVRFTELVIVVLIGAMLGEMSLTWHVAWFVPLLLLVIRPAAVLVGLWGTRLSHVQRPLVCWFGVRGIGSIYYLMFAIHRGVPEEWGETLTAVTLTTIAVSVVVHGTSVTPLMHHYRQTPGSGSESPQGA